MTEEGIFNKPLFTLLKYEDLKNKFKNSGVKVTFKEPENYIFIEGFKKPA
jgi:hypothetical protein